MERIQFAGFDWDRGNWPKCGKHGMSKAEVEEVFFNGPAVHQNPVHSETEERFKAIGQTNLGRYAYVSFTFRDGLIRPISARFMHKKEVERYEQAR
jgi:uncharacterized DUF497 family protein